MRLIEKNGKFEVVPLTSDEERYLTVLSKSIQDYSLTSRELLDSLDPRMASASGSPETCRSHQAVV